MVWLQRTLILIFVIVSLLLALAFMTVNENSVSVDFFLWQVSATVGVWMVLAFASGLVISLLASYPLIMNYKFRLKRAQRKQLELGASEPLSD